MLSVWQYYLQGESTRRILQGPFDLLGPVIVDELLELLLAGLRVRIVVVLFRWWSFDELNVEMQIEISNFAHAIERVLAYALDHQTFRAEALGDEHVRLELKTISDRLFLRLQQHLLGDVRTFRRDERQLLDRLVHRQTAYERADVPHLLRTVLHVVAAMVVGRSALGRRVDFDRLSYQLIEFWPSFGLWHSIFALLKQIGFECVQRPA